MAQPAEALCGPLAEENDEYYKSDAFRMQSMKVLPCSKRFVHDWTECPFAHPQEKARRRDPRVHSYTGIACPSMKKEGCCAFGDHCPYAHNVFEYWLHPTRYRTQLCNDGSNCKRKICFFAHSLDELRVPACKPFVSPESLATAAAAAASDAEAKRKAATVGSPLSAFASLGSGPSPQRASLGTLRAAAAHELRLSGASVGAPASPSPADEAQLGASPSDSAVQAALQQLQGASFSSQEQQVIELVTSLLAQDKMSPEQAASILQQILPPGALNTLQAHLNTPRASLEEARRYSDPLGGYRGSGPTAAEVMQTRASYGDVPPSAALQPQAQGLSLEQLAAMKAAQTMGFSGMSVQAQGAPVHMGSFADYQSDPRMSLESARSSFDTARMSYDMSGRPSLEGLSPRGSVDATYPSGLLHSFPSSGLYGAQLSSVPEQFPMINAPPPSASWGPVGARRFSLGSAADRLSQDLSRMSFEAAQGGNGGAARSAVPPTANPYASSFFTPGGPAPGEGYGLEQRLSAPAAPDHCALQLPPLPPVRTSAKSPDAMEHEAAAQQQQQLLGGTAMHRLH